MTSIWAHTMVKNEARWLWYAVKSVVDHVDRILLWDTGSTDGTLDLCKELVKRYPEKIDFKQNIIKTASDFPFVRQKMLDYTESDWFIMLDGDEIWWRDSILKLTTAIHNCKNTTESIYVPTVNVVGDIFHYQDVSAGKYRFGDKVGHYNLRAINRNIPGLHSLGSHGVWGWVDAQNNMIQNRGGDKVIFVDAPYLHTTFLPRSTSRFDDLNVPKRAKKLKYELGIEFPADFYYPEVLFGDTEKMVDSPWRVINTGYKLRAILETPFKKIKRKIWTSPAGY